jgi:hypothetical protein
MKEEQRLEEEKRLHVTFYTAPKLNKRKTEEEGRPIYDDVEKVKIQIPGDRRTVIGALAHDKSRLNKDTGQWMTYADRFPKHYEAFKAGQEQIGSGTPLSELSWLTAAKVAELRALKITTAEALSNVNQETLGKLGAEGHSLRDKAKAYIENAHGSADIVRLSSENDELKARLEALEKQMTSEPASSVSPENMGTPFDDWADEDVANWMTENGGAPDKRWKRETLLAAATELNEALSKKVA